MPTFNSQKTKLLKFVDKGFGIFFWTKKEGKNIEHCENIIVLGFFLIGDTLIFLPAIAALKKKYKDAKITILCSPHTKEILSFSGLVNTYILVNCPWITPFNKSIKSIFNFFYGIRIANKIAKYDLAVDFRGDWRNIFYMNFIKAERKISYNFTGGEYMLTDAVAPPNNISHFTDEALYLVEQLGCIIEENEKKPKLVLPEEEFFFVKSFFKKNNLLPQHFIIGIHPGASQEIKRWNEYNYIDIVKKINRKNTAYKFLIFEGPGEQVVVDVIQKNLEKVGINIIRVNEKLKQYVSILSACNLILCNDSGAGHIAGAFNIPLIVIFGNVDPKYVTPRSDGIVRVISHELPCKPCFQGVCPLGTSECIKSIKVDEVFFEIDKILDKLVMQNI
jgi:lipopolysaccharide heptosyltransferase II